MKIDPKAKPPRANCQYGGREKRLRGIAPKFRIGARSLLKRMPRQALHAAALGFVHPKTGAPMEFSAEMPEDMKSLLDVLKEGHGP